MHKYPQLQSLYLDADRDRSGNTVNKETAIQFLAYCSEIDKVDLFGLRLKLDIFAETFKNFWRDHSNPAVKEVEIKYSSNVDDVVALDIVEGNATKNKNYANIRYHGRTGDEPGHAKIIEDFGEMCETLIFVKIEVPKEASDFTKKILFGNFVAHGLYFCPHLQDLHIGSCEFKNIDFSSYRPSKKKENFRSLKIVNSQIRNIAFSQLSTVFKSLNHVQLKNNVYYCNDKVISGAAIEMIQTDIVTLTIEFTDRKYKSVFIEVFTPAWKESRYYPNNFQSAEEGIFKPSRKNDREYIDTPFFHIFVRCRSLCELQMIYDKGYYERLASISFQ